MVLSVSAQMGLNALLRQSCPLQRHQLMDSNLSKRCDQYPSSTPMLVLFVNNQDKGIIRLSLHLSGCIAGPFKVKFGSGQHTSPPFRQVHWSSRRENSRYFFQSYNYIMHR